MTRQAPAARRGVLAALGGGLLAGSAAAASREGPSRLDLVPPGVTARKEAEAEKRAPRYRETEHVQAFYRTNRY